MVLLKYMETWLLTFAFFMLFCWGAGRGRCRQACKDTDRCEKDTGDDSCAGNERDGHPYAAGGEGVPLRT